MPWRNMSFGYSRPTVTMHWRKADNEVARGKHSKVYLAGEATTTTSPENQPSSVIAVKTASLDQSDALKKELGFLDQFRHDPFVVQCFGWDQSLEGERWRYNLLLEHAPEGNLVDLMNSHGGTMPETMVAYYAYMILKGLSSVHSKGIVHCDVKPENILAFKAKNGFTQLKLADFGDSKYPRESDYNKSRGTVTYLSPESGRLYSQVHGKARDVWALGCTVVWMLSGGKTVWGHNMCEERLRRMLEAGRSPEIPKSVSCSGRDFLKQCFQPDHRLRPTVETLLRHHFIAGNTQGMLPPTGFEGKVANPFGRRTASTGRFVANPAHVKQEEEEKKKSVVHTYAHFQYTRVRRSKAHSSLYRTSTL